MSDRLEQLCAGDDWRMVRDKERGDVMMGVELGEEFTSMHMEGEAAIRVLRELGVLDAKPMGVVDE